MIRFVASLALFTMLCGFMSVSRGATIVEEHPDVAQFFPEADRFGETEGDPPAAPVYRKDKPMGYVFETRDLVNIPAYSGKPVNLLVGIDMAGTIAGAKVLEHHEPILLVGIPEERLHDFAADYVGKSLSDRIRVGAGKREGYVNIDAITGATVTVIVVNRTILRAARKVAIARGIIKPGAAARVPPAEVRMDVFREADWKYLTGNGAIRRLLLTRADVEQAFAGTPAEGPLTKVGEPGACETLPPGESCDVFIDMYYGYLNAPTIGRNLLGESQYNWLMAQLKPGEHAITVMANGVYSFKGSGYVRGGIFDRLQLVQGERTINFRDLDYYRLSDVYLEGMPRFSEMAIFIIREGAQFNPGAVWSLELLVRRQTGPLESVFTSFTAEYDIPPEYVTQVAVAEPEEEPMWFSVWRDRVFQIVVLLIGLVVLTLIMVLQDWLVRFPRLVLYLRTGFLTYTLFVVGWYMLGQLSVVNVLTFLKAVFTDFRWETFLIDPVMFILWSFVAVTVLLWGRGVYCGWLCPYGALQKLTSQIARGLRIPQFTLPPLIHDRLWGTKYIILMVLFAISLQSIGTAERYAEVEPFKTAITLRFDREWPFVLYAAGLVVVSLFNTKFYCKYLCPLGAALAVPTKLRLVNWLRRRKECGRPCQICAKECEIQAIHDTGEINAIECHYCLDCQVTYWDNHKCPPLVERRKRHERATRARKSVRWMEKELKAEAGLEQGQQGGEPPKGEES